MSGHNGKSSKDPSKPKPAQTSTNDKATNDKTESTNLQNTSHDDVVSAAAARRMKRLIVSGSFLVVLSIAVAVLSVVWSSDVGFQVKERLLSVLTFIRGECEDRNTECAFWASQGECTANPDYMTRICTKSCQLCSTPPQDKPVPLKEKKKTDTPVASEPEDGDSEYGDEEEDYDEEDDEGDIAEGVDDYDDEADEDEAGAPTGVPRFLSEEEVREREEDKEDEPGCEDSDADCPGWARSGECENNPNWMLENCQKSCNSCGGRRARAARDDDEEEDVKLEPVEGCEDRDPDCSGFADRGECEKNPDWMHENCQKSCGMCGSRAITSDSSCVDDHKDCDFWAGEGECEANPTYMLQHCRKSCEVCTEATRPNNGGEDDNKGVCRNRHPDDECEKRAREGECERNPGWMIVMCGKSCDKCSLQLQKHRCLPEVFNDTEYTYESALRQPGDLEKVFLRVIREYPKTEILLQPPKGPWVLRLPDFVTPLERETLLNMTLPHAKRSTDQGAFDEMGVQEQVVSQGRTSSNAWCFSECENHPVVAGMTQRVASLLSIPQKNFESYQVLQYKKNQKYDVHHDSSDEDLADMAGPRILTFFMYFSDVEEGGETFFDKLGLKVKPQTGSAILWPSVLDETPGKIDWRTTHAALPVIKGTKYAANLWVHMRDFKTPNLWGCTGSFD